MTPLQELINLCNSQVVITANEHKMYYKEIEDYLKNDTDIYEDNTEDDIIKNIIENDCLIELRAYPTTPIGFLNCYHYDINMAIDEMIKYIKK